MSLYARIIYEKAIDSYLESRKPFPYVRKSFEKNRKNDKTISLRRLQKNFKNKN